MRTCKYCGTELIFQGELNNEKYFNCSFCEMDFVEADTSMDRKRKEFVPEYIDILKAHTTKELLQVDTITLFHMLREANKFWYHIKSTLEKMSKVELNEESKATLAEIREEYNNITKRKFVLENIILERTGFLPKKINEEFLGSLVALGEIYNNKPMYIYLKS